MLMGDNYGGGMVASMMVVMVAVTAIVGVAIAGGGRW